MDNISKAKRVDFTAEWIDSIPVSTTRTVFYDTEQPSLSLEISPLGKKVYFIVGRAGGKRVHVRLANTDRLTVSQARKQAKKYLSQYEVSGTSALDRPPQAETITLKQVYSKWQTWRSGRGEDAKSLHDLIGGLRTFFDTPVAKIDKAAVEAWQAEKIARGLMPSTVNRYLTALKTLINWAVSSELIKEAGTGKEAKKLSESGIEPRHAHFSPEERQALLDAALAHSKRKPYHSIDMAYAWPLTVLLLKTGLRPSTALGLRWEDIDLPERKVFIRQGNIKTRSSEVSLMGAKLTAVMSEWKASCQRKAGSHDIRHDKVFPVHDFSHQFRAILKKAGMSGKGYTLYSLRHDCASEVARLTGSALDVQHLLHHKSTRMGAKYIKSDEGRERDVANLLDADA